MQTLPKAPELDRRLQLSTVYHSTAMDTRVKPQLYASTYDFQGTASWLEIGTQVLVAAGRRPNCVLEEEVNVAKFLSPNKERNFITVEPSDLLKHSRVESLPGNQAWPDDPQGGVNIATCVFSRTGLVRDVPRSEVRQVYPACKDGPRRARRSSNGGRD